jgi:hypothetical protein
VDLVCECSKYPGRENTDCRDASAELWFAQDNFRWSAICQSTMSVDYRGTQKGSRACCIADPERVTEERIVLALASLQKARD